MRALAVPAAVVASALLMTACGAGSGGGSGPSGSPAAGGTAAPTLGQEYPAIKSAALSATSVRLSGSVVQGGKRLGLDMALVKPADAAGSVSEGGTRFTIVAVSGKAWIKINRPFLRLSHLPTSLCAKACGKYLVAPASAAADFTNFRLASLLRTMFKHGPNAAESRLKLTTTQFGGQPAWSVSGEGVTMYISKGSTPYLMSMTFHGQHVSFSDWNTAKVTAPPASKVLTLAQLGALATGG